MRSFFTVSTVFFLLFSGMALRAQHPVQQDSSGIFLAELQDLVRSGNFENAAIASIQLRDWLNRSGAPCPAAAVPLLSGIYKANKDERSAYQFLGEAELDARYDRDPERRSQLLKAIVKSFEDWNDPQRALSNQKLLDTVRDSVVATAIRRAQQQFESRLDSIQAVRQLEAEGRPELFSMEKSQALVLGLVLLTLLLGLLISNYRAATRWQKRLLHKDIEMDLLRANLRPADTIPPFVAEAQAREQQAAGDRAVYPGGEVPEQIALIIEPNRQVVLYLKSLLSDRFQIETAHSAAEGLQVANKLLPDLVVCDAVLNGQTGVDVVRQIKLSDKTNHIPVILLSERFGNEGRLDALRAGAEAWFTRPVLDSEFDQSVAQLMQARKEKQLEFARFLHLCFSPQRLPLNDAFLRQSVELIERNLGDPDFMADDLARKMQMTNHLFTKKLKTLTGKEPAQLIREMRLEKAKVLLENRAGLPQNIAELVGFSNAGSFAMAFKDYFGENTLLLR